MSEGSGSERPMLGEESGTGSWGEHYSSFLSERRLIIEARQRSQQRIDQVITGGAAGALVLSITFVDKIASLPNPESTGYLITAWITLLASLLCNFVAGFASVRAFDDALDKWDATYSGQSVSDARLSAKNWTVWLGWTSAGFFVVGVALLAWFAIENLGGVGNVPTDS